ncbi:protein phosphatase 1 regulatory inhibitor subunit 14A L homeolog isoform X1 [Xenopus laevis]|uniref:Protein phosphatase 1 regulatory inhibitor subunit 14A L homeolog isoform X1 n=1 Tax=Xenopus laevis TaxID=8355 RepID=A0A8J1LG67_XENLA|nr:protein phosphatase 1 regulatory inhibitor subunit 14A L homeolog isoform X1 [Xenopus laevis]
MAANKVGKRLTNKPHSPSKSRDSNQGIQRRQARITVKYDRKELQKRLDVEKWIDEQMEELYLGREVDMPDEVNIDDLLDLETDEDRRRSLQVFIRELLLRLKGLQKQTLLKKNGLEVSSEEHIVEHA